MAYEKPTPAESPAEPEVRTIPDEDVIRHPPLWFRQALAAPRESRRLTVDGTAIHYLRWGNDDPKRPGLLFVHGNGAHAEWFSFIAPLLTDRYNVAALDLGGMGDSDWRPSYSRDSFAHEIGQVALHAGLGPKPVVVGHSFGGFVSLIAGKHYGDRLGGLLLCDFQIRPPHNPHDWYGDGNPSRPTRVYPDFETAKARFRLAPLQPCANGFVIDHIGPLSLREVKVGDNPGRGPSKEAGWTWKFDPGIYRDLPMGNDHAEIYRSLACPAAAMFGMESRDYDPEIVAFMKELTPGNPLFAIPGAQHHIMLDQPHAFASGVAAMMALWETQGALG